MKTIQLGCKRLIAAAVVAAALAAKADTVVHYTFDDLGEGGSSFTGLIDEVRISDCVLAPSEFLHTEKEGGLILIFR